MTDDDKFLVERLRDHANQKSNRTERPTLSQRILKSADRIEALSAENERLRELLNHVADQADHDCETMWITDIIRAALGETE